MYVCINAGVVVVQVGGLCDGGDEENMEHKRCSCGEHCGCNPCTCSKTDILLLLHLLLLLAGPSATVVLAAPVSLVPLNLPQGKKEDSQ